MRCLSRGGNPAASIRWLLGEKDLTVGYSNQTNTTDVARVKTWMAVSTLTYTFGKADHLQQLRCVALHEAYPGKSRESSVTLDIHCEFIVFFCFRIFSFLFYYDDDEPKPLERRKLPLIIGLPSLSLMNGIHISKRFRMSRVSHTIAYQHQQQHERFLGAWERSGDHYASLSK